MEQLFGAIPLVLNGLGPNAEVEEAVAFAAWGRCAGEMLRIRTCPVQFFENRLVIAVADETWRRHLEDLSPQMLVKLNDLLGQGTVTFIEFRVNASMLRSAGSGNADPLTESIDAVAPSLTKAAGAITDESLRKQFLATAANYLAKQK